MTFARLWMMPHWVAHRVPWTSIASGSRVCNYTLFYVLIISLFLHRLILMAGHLRSYFSWNFTAAIHSYTTVDMNHTNRCRLMSVLPKTDSWHPSLYLVGKQQRCTLFASLFSSLLPYLQHCQRCDSWSIHVLSTFHSSLGRHRVQTVILRTQSNKSTLFFVPSSTTTRRREHQMFKSVQMV